MLICRVQPKEDDMKPIRSLTRICYGSFECHPAIYSSLEAWVFGINYTYYPRQWRMFDAWEVMWNAGGWWLSPCGSADSKLFALLLRNLVTKPK